MHDGSLGQPIAHGRTADVYAWKDGYILKRFHPWFDLENIKYEADINRAVYDSGLSVPAVGDVIQVDGCNALIYERIDGPTMFEAVQEKPWRIFAYGKRLGNLHAQIHAYELKPDVPSLYKQLRNKMRHARVLPAHLQSTLLSLLEELPQGNRICHGDFHPGNVMLTTKGDIAIDWIDVTVGNPLADVARTAIISLGAAASDQIPNPLMKGFARLFHAIYLRRYFRLRPGGEHEYCRWLPIVAAARLSENIPELEEWLVAQAQKSTYSFT